MSGPNRPLPHIPLWSSHRVIYIALLPTATSVTQCEGSALTPLTSALYVRRPQPLFRSYEMVPSRSGFLSKKGTLWFRTWDCS